jgi:hypothetical protein
MTKEEILEDIELILERLAKPLTTKDIADGWSIECRKMIIRVFEDIKATLLSEGKLPPMFIARGLDHWGVIDGDLLEFAAKISNKLRRYSS